MDYQRLYEYRFRDVDQAVRRQTWQELAPFVYERLGHPERVLDPAAGRCEFISAVPARERWAVDEVAYEEAARDGGLRFVQSDVMRADLPRRYFDGIWVSNFLEHLPDQQGVAAFLERMRDVARPGGRIAIMGPNFRYCAREYFDCADHNVLLTHVGVAEHVYAAGFEVESVVPRFLPYSFRGRLPVRPGFTSAYLRFPAAWRLLGRQFLVVGRRPQEVAGG
jgi:SAM-dependent methyltransferase